MFRFDENVFRGGGAVKGPFFRERDIFFFAYDDDGRTCFTGRPRYKAVVGNRFYQVVPGNDDKFAGFLIAAGPCLHARLHECQQVFFCDGSQFLEVAAGASFENFIHIHSSFCKRVRQKRGISP